MELWQTAEDIRTVLIVDLYPRTGCVLICLSSLFVTEKNTCATLFLKKASDLSKLKMMVSKKYFRFFTEDFKDNMAAWVQKSGIDSTV